jgi:uncharacterized membrane protein YozB (DUF420 family)
LADILFMNQMNLVLQIVIFLILSISILLKYRGKVIVHAKLMVVAYALNIASLLFIMVPLFLTGLPIVSSYPDSYAYLFVIHHIIGLIALLLSTFVVLRYVRGKFTARYCRGKWIMRATGMTWAAALILGLYLYYIGYFPG